MSLIGYQFDLCEVPPSAEAMADYVNSGRKNKVLKGYRDEFSLATSGLNIIVGTGAAMIFGRLLINAVEERVTVRANASGYLVLTVDLTQPNVATGVPGSPEYSVINRQIRLEVVDSLIQRDLFNGEFIYTFPLARYTSTGTTITLTKNVDSYEVIKSKGDRLYTGSSLLNSGQNVNLSRNIADCENGIILTFVPHENGVPRTDGYVQCFLSNKVQLGKTYLVNMFNLKDTVQAEKAVVITGANQLGGAAFNVQTTPRYNMVLTFVDSY